jgi:hypothetical protein
MTIPSEEITDYIRDNPKDPFLTNFNIYLDSVVRGTENKYTRYLIDKIVDYVKHKPGYPKDLGPFLEHAKNNVYLAFPNPYK